MPINIPSQLPALTIDKKLPSLTPQDAQILNDQIVSVDNLVSINISGALQSQNNQSFSPRLMNWVEPYVISPYTYSLFYTEVNSNLKEGDRVYIVGGNYDSNDFISQDKYSKRTDGYRVLFVDRCKLVLDIDYTGTKVWNQDPFDQYIKVYAADTQEKFDYYAKMLSGSDITNPANFNYYKLASNRANIIYTTHAFSGIASGIGFNTGILGPNQFWIRDCSTPNGDWLNVTTQFWNNTFTTSDVLSTEFTSNGKLWIIDDFSNSGYDFLKNRTYTYTNGYWAVDPDFRPVVGKTNFRSGTFKSGKFNGGIYGNQHEQLVYRGDNIEWNTGTLFNAIWETGQMGSTVYDIDSFETELDIDGLPKQKSIAKNNDGWGYNYIIDSVFHTFEIGHGNFFNSIFGTMSLIDPVMKDYLTGTINPWSKMLTQGAFESCEIYDCPIEDSELKYCQVYNSQIDNTKSINSTIVDSVFLNNSVFTSNDSIQILGFFQYQKTISGTLYNVYKFFISDTDYYFFKTFNHFYINGLTIADEAQKIINYFNKRFVLNSYFDSDDYLNLNDYTVEVSSTLDNANLLSNSGNLHNMKRSSIDIITSDTFVIDSSKVDVSNAYIWTSDFRSGIFDGSKWVQGNLINLTFDNHIVGDPIGSGYHDISVLSATHLGILIGTASQVSDYLKIGDPIFINGINFEQSITGKNWMLHTDYLVENITYINPDMRFLDVSEILTGSQTSKITPISTLTGKFNVLGAKMTNNWINRVKITNSEIQSGLMRRQFVYDSTFVPNGIFNSADIDMSNLTNLKSLILSDMLLSNNKNDIRSGLFYNTVFISGTDVFNDGFFYNSYWNGHTFSQQGGDRLKMAQFNGGTFRESEWLYGSFNGGYFYKNSSNTMGTSSLFTNNTISEYYLVDNIRYSWIGGEMNGGTFSKSHWENGIFKGGRIYNANFFKGTMSGGHFGSSTVPFKNTQMWSGNIIGGSVDNAYVYGQDPTIQYLSDAQYRWDIDWRYGLFMDGQFGNDFTNNRTMATWSNGIFSGGQFIDGAIWKSGTFSGGKFLSTKNWQNGHSTSPSNYTWWNGNFTGGYFGNKGLTANSTWYTGEFSGGHFQGRVWNDGILTSGYFNGSGVGSAAANFQDFMDNSGWTNDLLGTGSYYGLWRNGIVTDVKDRFITDKKIWTTKQREFTKKKFVPQAILSDFIWLAGTFSHPNGEVNNAVWLDGSFEDGYFYNSSFNPFSTRPTSGNFAVIGATGFNWYPTCVWENGQLEESVFNFSEWKNGRFISGTAWGALWEDGIADYMNAYNCIWNNGIWRNGNWNGAPFNMWDIDYTTYRVRTDLPAYSLLVKNALVEWDSNIFLNNALTQSGYYPNGVSYSVDYNNKKSDLFSGGDIQIPNIEVFTILPVWNIISLNFGNAKFKSGVWQNGVWQNGWREDDTFIFDTVDKAYKLDPNTWRVFISRDSTTPVLYPGDVISVGNITFIDINEKRRLLQNAVKVVGFTDDSITQVLSFDIQSNFPIRRIEMDSEEHLIYVTKNVWLNGLFINGVWNKGVWNNGLFKGKPFLTEMFDTHWIDGTFDGGHFKGLTDVDGNHTGLIQNFTFFDNNIAPAYDFKYNSWIDVNYFTSSGVNLNKQNKVYKESPLGFTASYTENNLYGYPTKDVLQSISYIRDGFSTKTYSYSLGWKAKKYTDYISPFGAPDFSDTINTLGLPGDELFVENGWRYSNFKPGAYNTYAQATASYQANYFDLESGKLYISSTYSNRIPLTSQDPSPSDISWYKVDSLENVNTLEIPQNRYSVIELEVESRTHSTIPSCTTSNTLLFFNNYPATYSIPYLPILFADRIISSPVNMLWTGDQVKREYFFNKPSLQMEIFSGNTYSLAFDRISFIEVDMIPFMQIMSDNFGKFRYLNWEEDERAWGPPPYLDGATETEELFWENVYRIDTGGPGNTNINHDVQVPYYAVAPVVDYSDPNFNYLSAILVGINTLNNSVS